MGAVELRALVFELHHGFAVLACEEGVRAFDRHGHGRELVLHELAHGLTFAIEDDLGVNGGDILHRLRRRLSEAGGDAHIAAAFRLREFLGDIWGLGGEFPRRQLREAFPGDEGGMRLRGKGVALQKVTPLRGDTITQHQLTRATAKRRVSADPDGFLGEDEILGEALPASAGPHRPPF